MKFQIGLAYDESGWVVERQTSVDAIDAEDAASYACESCMIGARIVILDIELPDLALLKASVKVEAPEETVKLSHKGGIH